MPRQDDGVSRTHEHTIGFFIFVQHLSHTSRRASFECCKAKERCACSCGWACRGKSAELRGRRRGIDCEAHTHRGGYFTAVFAATRARRARPHLHWNCLAEESPYQRRGAHAIRERKLLRFCAHPAKLFGLRPSLFAVHFRWRTPRKKRIDVACNPRPSAAAVGAIVREQRCPPLDVDAAYPQIRYFQPNNLPNIHSPERAATNCFSKSSTSLAQLLVSGATCIHVAASSRKRARTSVQSATVPNSVTSGIPQRVRTSYLCGNQHNGSGFEAEVVPGGALT
jgi:hypothetical protein